MTKPIVFNALMLIGLCGSVSFAQTNAARSRNNPYSPSPSSSNVEIATNIAPADTTIASTDIKVIAKTAVSPTEVYKVGIGDVLHVNVKNSVNASGYYTVRGDGTIDFSIAGGNVTVTGRTTDEIASELVAKITLYRDPQVQVTVREYGSHKVTVSGLVERAGMRSIQREAVPLYVICADAMVQAKATSVIVKRENQKVESFDLKDQNIDKVLIYPGDSVEFGVDAKSFVSAGTYYITGEVHVIGRHELATGMKLMQAIIAAGGAKGDPKKVLIRRKAEDGRLTLTEYNLRSIRSGKSADPVLLPGDMIELVK